MPSNQTKNQHLMWRAGFGPATEQLEQLKEISPKALFKALQKASSKKPAYIDVADDYLKGLFMGAEEAGRQQQKKALEEADRKMVRQKQRDSIKSLNLTWLEQLVSSDAQLREKMAFFWHGHFASRNLNIFFQQQLLDIIRQNALGSFRTLLLQVSQSAAMLNFLNAAQNKKDHPNENFAREVMELFTMGRGHYTEQDIKEAARAFTGWSSNIKGEFVFRRFQHDTDNKTVLGKTGNFTGEDVLDILLDHEQTARYITQKIYRYFVNETVDNEKVEWLSKRFFQSDYNISQLMEDIFTADWFYDEKNIGTRIKSPVELVVGMQRMLPMAVDNEEALLLVQRLLGQLLFYPPNVAGWPGGKNWIDSSSLMFRLRLPQLFTDADEFNIRPKTDDDMTGGQEERSMGKNGQSGKAGKPIQADIFWKLYTKQFDSVSRENLLTTLQATLLQVVPRYGKDIIQNYADSSGRENFIKSTTVQIMSTPEYQMC
ncbi:DUF1800 domain-containing protein [Flavisolibacter tropicus]|uniref:Uncharacterized protein n=1 Tax=Flavisolibacter tropicus TaxID=1492898 RepID=A0A172TYQ7_9BACT|nr:DUF1800 domain-containing protein [Flavisolibacter tropicus]ANE52215.1 hypothetical protein SY85_18690 [Flavisolibacter tropicus]